MNKAQYTEEKRRIVVCDLVTSCGGVQQVMANLLPKLAEQFDITVVDPYVNRDYAEKFCDSGVKMYFTRAIFKKPYIGGGGTWKRLPNLILAIPRIFKIGYMFAKAIGEIKPDYLYVNQLPALRILTVVNRLYNIPLIYHCHGPNRHGEFKPADISPSSARAINSVASRVIVVSHSTGNVLRRAGVQPDIMHVCHNAVCIEKIERCGQLPISEPLPDRRSGQVIFLLPAAIQYRKGHHLAIEALASVVKKGYNVGLWFSGDVAIGGNRRYLEELHRTVDELGLTELVHFLGWRQDVYQVMTASDVVMLCSLSDSESFGMVLAEAMVLSKPCMGARIGGMPEVISENQTGLLFEPGSYHSLAEAMTVLASSKEMRENFGKAGRKRVEELFSINIQADRISNILAMIPA